MQKRRGTYAILSGWPSPTDSEVNRKVSPLPWVPLVTLPILLVLLLSGRTVQKAVEKYRGRLYVQTREW
jgi:hypothetical protein